MRPFLRLERRTIRDGTETVTVTDAITSLPPGRLTPEELLKALRGRWDIDNRAF